MPATVRRLVQVVGSSAKYPGDLSGAAGFWRGLAGAAELQRRVPLERWDWGAYFTPEVSPGAMTINAPFGAFCDGVDAFDTALFGLSAGEAATIDPQQRQLLEQVAGALHQARPAMAAQRAAARGEAPGAGLTGVYVGCMYHEWVEVMAAHGQKLAPRCCCKPLPPCHLYYGQPRDVPEWHGCAPCRLQN